MKNEDPNVSFKKIIKISVVVLILLGVYYVFFDTPWNRAAFKQDVTDYLTEKYQKEFVIDNVDFDFFRRNYGTYAYPVDDPTLRFYVGHNISDPGIHDAYDYELDRRKRGLK